MCLTVPMRVEEIDGHRARCVALGEERWADLMLMGDDLPKVGDYVAIHLGFVQRVVPEAEAMESHRLFEEIAETLARQTPET
ncbi:MAG: HypC/HybG/HupF family hydrogenase formation chaperone [Alphaproteobacteria bacterium]|nr:MAG: HypC/HybG/HupF family hydrogenase formation chaperone [Alphaproteobacteria bacterium]